MYCIDVGVVEQLIKTLCSKEYVDTDTAPSLSVFPQDPRVKPEDWVFIKVIKKKCWSDSRWEGPHRIILSTPTAVKVEGRTAGRISLTVRFQSTAEEGKPDSKGD